MKYFYLIFIIFVLCSVTLCTKGSILNRAYAKTDGTLFFVNDRPYDHTFPYWVVKWFDWFLSLPNIENVNDESKAHPRDHYSPEKCSWNQNGSSPVWMLSDGPDKNDLSVLEARDCKVPAGKALLVQIVGSNCSPNEGYKNDQELLNCAAWILDQARFSASVDGKEVLNTDKNLSDKEKIYTKPFITPLNYGKNNYYHDPEGKVRGAGAGYFLFVKPLPVGNHIIKYEESVVNALDSTGNDKRISGLEYHIDVENMTR